MKHIWLLLILCGIHAEIKGSGGKDRDAEIARKATKKEVSVHDDECAICLNEKFRTPVILPCSHIFCRACLQNWIQKTEEKQEQNLSCPMCQKQYNLESIASCSVLAKQSWLSKLCKICAPR